MSQPKNHGVKRNRNLALGCHEYVSLPSADHSFEILSKNFPFLKNEEISHILRSDAPEDESELLAQLKIKKAVQPFLEEQQQKFRASAFGQRAPILKETAQQPRVSKKRSRQAFNQAPAEQEN